MKRLITEKVGESGIIYQHPYIWLYSSVEQSIIEKIQNLHDKVEYNEFSVICGVGGSSFDIMLGHKFEMMTSNRNIEVCEECTSIVKAVFAFGYAKLLNVVPSNWNVTALVEFPDGIPELFNYCKDNNPFLLSSLELYNAIKKLHEF